MIEHEQTLELLRETRDELRVVTLTGMKIAILAGWLLALLLLGLECANQ